MDENGQLTLDSALDVTSPQRVRLIILLTEEDSAPDETPTQEVIEGIQQGFKEALSGQTLPLASMWEGIDAE